MLLRKLADNGQAILCTIHQPSSQLFHTFDRLLLLGNGGDTLYFGEVGQNGDSLINYFEENGAPKCPPEGNPAEWVLDVTQYHPGGLEAEPGQTREAHEAWAQKWKASTQGRAVLQEIARLKDVSGLTDNSQSADNNTHRRGEYAASWLTQFLIVTHRLFQDNWRDPVYVYSKLLLCIGLVSMHRNIKHLPQC